MAYDGTGRRTSKTIDNSGDWNYTYHFYYDGQSMIETRNGSNKVIKQHVWGTQYVDEIIQIGTNDDPTDTEQNCEKFYYAAQDANYNVIGLIGQTTVKF